MITIAIDTQSPEKLPEVLGLTLLMACFSKSTEAAASQIFTDYYKQLVQLTRDTCWTTLVSIAIELALSKPSQQFSGQYGLYILENLADSFGSESLKELDSMEI